MRILVVEDSEVCRGATEALLCAQGHEVVSVARGADGVAQAAAGSFDLILMDLGLPDLNGLEAARRIQAAGGAPPIVALTGRGGVETRRRCREAGLVDFVAKPVRPEALAEVVRRVGDVGGPRWSASIRALGASLRVSLAREFAAEAPRLLAALERALAGGDLPAARHAAHTLYGALIHFDSASAHAAVRAVEDAALASNLRAARAGLAAVERETRAVLADVERAIG